MHNSNKWLQTCRYYGFEPLLEYNRKVFMLAESQVFLFFSETFGIRPSLLEDRLDLSDIFLNGQ